MGLKLHFKSFFVFSVISFGMLQTVSVLGAEQHDELAEHEQHQDKVQHTIEKRLAEMKNVTVYSCDLTIFSHQCREYPVPEKIKSKIEAVSEGCESMPEGKFRKGVCSSEGRVGRCIHILRDYHDPESLIYDNHYYGGDRSHWSEIEARRVCGDLGGKFLEK